MSLLIIFPRAVLQVRTGSCIDRPSSYDPVTLGTPAAVQSEFRNLLEELDSQAGHERVENLGRVRGQLLKAREKGGADWLEVGRLWASENGLP